MSLYFFGLMVAIKHQIFLKQVLFIFLFFKNLVLFTIAESYQMVPRDFDFDDFWRISVLSFMYRIQANQAY
jgi:hypothetical protein